MYIPEKVHFSICGLFISYLNDDSKESLLTVLRNLAATNNSELGWTAFGKTTITSFSWALSSVFGKTSTKNVGLKKYALEGYNIINLISSCDVVNGKIIESQNIVEKNLKRHEKWYKVEHHKADSLTSCIKATFYSIQIKETSF